MCTQRPEAVAALPVDESNIDLIWSCEDHIPDLVAIVRERGEDPKARIREVSRTCRALNNRDVPCGAAGDYLVIWRDGSVTTVCKRHFDAWRPA